MEIDKTKGYIKLWRCFMDERIFANKDLWQLWTWLLMKANHTDKDWSVVTKGGGQIEVQVNRGELVFGRTSAGKELNAKPTTIWKRLQKLKTLGFCDIKSDKNYSIVSICNYDEMFVSAESRVTSSGERTVNDRLMKVTHLKNGENVNNVKKKEKSRPKPSSLSDSEWILSLNENPAYKGIDIPILQGKMVAWCELKNLKPTRKRLLNWLNREDRQMEGSGVKATTREQRIQEWIDE